MVAAARRKSTANPDGSGSLLVGYTGRHLDGFHLDLDSLTRGLVIVGQSGCGKSFFLARLLEEMVLEGRLKDNFLVIDANSDFRRGLVEAKTPNFNKWLQNLSKSTSSPDDPRFKSVCKSERESRATVKGAQGCKNAKVFGSNSSPFNLDWRGVLSDERELLRCLPTWEEHSVEYQWCLSWALHDLRTQSKSEPPSLKRLHERFWEQATKMALSKSKVVNPETERGLAIDLKQMATSGEWRKNADDRGLPEGLLDQRVNILETECLNKKEARLRVVLRSLEFLWQTQLETRMKILNTDKSSRAGSPTNGRPAWFIFVEEAHRLAPEPPLNPLARRVSELLQRIASEGRKYGLHLVLATQRPTKVARGLLGECDNAIIMKMNSRVDLEFLAHEMRILDVKLLEAALHFHGKGNALAIGEAAGAAPNVVQFMTAPRRSAEGGGDLTR